MNLRSVTVPAFEPPETEHLFLIDSARRFAVQRKLATLIGLTFPLFISVDWWLLLPGQRALFIQALLARVPGIAGATIGSILIWKRYLYDELAVVRVLATAAACFWLSLLALIAFYPGDVGFRFHFPGLLLELFVVFTLFRFRATVAWRFSLFCVTSFYLMQFCRYLTGRVEQEEAIFECIVALFFLCLECVIGVLICSQFEHEARRDFMLRRSLRASKERVDSASEAIRHQNERMKELVSERERFFSSAYHDIQQPLAAINLFARSAHIKLARRADASSDIEVIQQTSRDIVEMFKEIQDYTELGSYNPKITNVVVDEVIEEVRDQFLSLAVSRGIEFRCKRRGRRPPDVQSDRPLLKRLLSNFVSNALKNTTRGGIAVNWVCVNCQVRIDVWDTGIGIAKVHHHAIFQEYFQINNPGRDRSKGLGLGLSIARRVAQTLPHHRISFASVEGRGSRFSVYVPIARNKHWNEDESRKRTIPSTALSGMYMYICDDNRVVLQGLRQLFEQAGALVDVAESRQDINALIALDARAPDLFITDVRLGNNDNGIVLAQSLRDRFAWAGVIPVAFITGELGTPSELSHFSEPFVLLRKSADPAQLVDDVRGLMYSSGFFANRAP